MERVGGGARYALLSLLYETGKLKSYMVMIILIAWKAHPMCMNCSPLTAEPAFDERTSIIIEAG